MSIEIKNLINSLGNEALIKENSPKLVRNKIPQIYSNNNWQYHVATINEFHQYLRKKLLEEVEEFLMDESLDEIADVLEVLDAFAELKNWSADEVLQAKLNKTNNRGNFSKRLIATKVTTLEKPAV